MNLLRFCKPTTLRTALLALCALALLQTSTPVHADVGSQHIVLDVQAHQGWTTVVPMHLNLDGRTDLLSYNATTGRTGVFRRHQRAGSPTHRARYAGRQRLDRHRAHASQP